MHNIIVTGMHRSGTSAIGRVLHEGGYKMGGNLLPASSSNIYGHFEEADFVKFHDSLISKYFQRGPCSWLLRAENQRFSFRDMDRGQAKRLWESFNAIGNKGFKDPRASLFIKFWKELVPSMKFVICVRHPYDVYLSMRRRNEKFQKTIDISNDPFFVNNWLLYNKFIYDEIKFFGTTDFLVLNINKEFSNANLLNLKLSHFIDFNFSHDNIKIDLNIFTKPNLITPEEILLFAEWFPKTQFIYNKLIYIAETGNINIDEIYNGSPNKGTILEFEQELAKMRS